MRRLVGLGFGCWLVAAASAQAQAIDGAGRFGLDTVLVSLQTASVLDIDATVSEVGIGTPGFGVVLGGGVNENVELGVSAMLDHRSISTGGQSASLTQLDFVGHAEYVFSGSGSTRGYLGLRM